MLRRATCSHPVADSRVFSNEPALPQQPGFHPFILGGIVGRCRRRRPRDNLAGRANARLTPTASSSRPVRLPGVPGGGSSMRRHGWPAVVLSPLTEPGPGRAAAACANSRPFVCSLLEASWDQATSPADLHFARIPPPPRDAGEMPAPQSAKAAESGGPGLSLCGGLVRPCVSRERCDRRAEPAPPGRLDADGGMDPLGSRRLLVPHLSSDQPVARGLALE